MTDKESTDRWSYLWFLLGVLCWNLIYGLHVMPVAAWLCWLFLIRFMRTQPSLRGYFLIGAADVISTSVDAWEGSVPFTGEILVGILVFAVLTSGIPFLFDKLITHHIEGFGSTLAFPMAVTAGEFLLLETSPAGSFGSVGYSQYGNLPLMQLVSLTGIWGLTFLIAWFAAVVNWAWEHSFRWPEIRFGMLAYTSIMVLVMAYGGGRLALSAIRPTESVAVVSFTMVDSRKDWGEFVIGGPGWQGLVLRGEGSDAFRHVSRGFHDLYFAETSRQASSGPKIVLWPEAAGITWGEEDKEALLNRARQVARDSGIYLVIPTYRMDGEGKQPPENTLVFVDPMGETVLEHVKFGGNVFEGSVEGNGILQTTDTPYGRLSGAICWDMDFPSIIRQSGQNGTDILLAPAGDWREISPFHAQMSVFRAIENGVSLVRQADNGLSIATDPYGRVLAAVDHFASSERIMRAQVPIEGITTAYAIIGDVFAWLSVIGCAGIFGYALLRRRGKETSRLRVHDSDVHPQK